MEVEFNQVVNSTLSRLEAWAPEKRAYTLQPRKLQRVQVCTHKCTTPALSLSPQLSGYYKAVGRPSRANSAVTAEEERGEFL